MNQNDVKERQYVFMKTWDDLLTRDLSNSEKTDNTILITSLTALGLSLILAVCKAGLENLHLGWCLVTSWWCFGLAAISTMISFWSSNNAIRRQFDSSQKYYLEEKSEYFNKRSAFHALTDILNYISGILFILAIVFTIVFVSSNLHGL